jgi:uncharacterized protein involved in exopolysaccharide biosynthesis
MDSQISTDLSDYVAALKRRRLLLASISVPIIGIALALAVGLPDIYSSTALIEFSQATISGDLPQRGQPQKSYADQYVSSLSDVVLSAKNLQPMVAARKDRDLDDKDAIERVQNNTEVETVRTQVLDPDTGREREVVSAFTVTYDSRDPNEAQQGAKWLSDQFLQASRGNLRQRAVSSAQFYAAEADRYREQITALEAKLADFKGKNYGQLPESADMNMNIVDRTERDLDNVEMQLQSLRQDRIFLAQALENARNASPDANLLTSLEAQLAQKEAIYDDTHPDILALRRQIENLRRGGPALDSMSLPQQLTAQRAILAQTKQRYSADHPDVKRIQRKIENLEQRIASGEKADNTLPSNPTVTQVRTQINGVDTQIAGLNNRGSELRAKLAMLEKRMESSPMVEREYQTLTRDMQLARAKYDELLKSRMDAESTEAAIAGGRSDELRLVQPPATPSSPSRPARTGIAVVGFILAVVLGLTAVVLAEGMDQTVRGSRDVRRMLAVSPLAVIPRIQDAAAMRQQRFKLAMLAGCTVVGSAIVVMVMRSLS